MRIFTPLVTLFILTACSTSQTYPSNSSSQPSQATPAYFQDLSKPIMKSSKVEIEYTLGRDRYRLNAEDHDHNPYVIHHLAGRTLAQGSVDEEKYGQFLESSVRFINFLLSQPPHPVPCRNPYKITIQIEAESHTLHGCRSSDQGKLSKLIKEGEFLLLYSKN